MSKHWSDEMVGKFTLLWNLGLHWAVIAENIEKEFGVTMTKAALLGRRKRLGLTARLTPPPREPRIPHRDRHPQALPALESNPVTFEAVGHGECRYILEDAWPYTCCGGKADGPWCPHHRAIVYQPRTKREAARG